MVIPGYKVPEDVPIWHSGLNYAKPYITIGLWEDGCHTKLPDLKENRTIEERPIMQLAAPNGCRVMIGPEAHPLARQFFDKTLKGAVEESKIKIRST